MNTKNTTKEELSSANVKGMPRGPQKSIYDRERERHKDLSEEEFHRLFSCMYGHKVSNTEHHFTPSVKGIPRGDSAQPAEIKGGSALASPSCSASSFQFGWIIGLLLNAIGCAIGFIIMALLDKYIW